MRSPRDLRRRARRWPAERAMDESGLSWFYFLQLKRIQLTRPRGESPWCCGIPGARPCRPPGVRAWNLPLRVSQSSDGNGGGASTQASIDLDVAPARDLA